MQVTPNVRVVQVPEEEPMRPRSTNIYLVGTDQVMSIDSGEAIDKFKWMLRGYLAAIERTEIALAGITHHHYDHSGNLKDLREALHADVLIPEAGIDLLAGRLPENGVQTITDGKVVDLGAGGQLRVIATPGHSVDSVCYYLEEDGVLFTGDTLLGVGTTTVQDLAAYRSSLRTLVELPNLQVICPGHGPLVHDARERLRSYIDHRNVREEQILQMLQSGGPTTSWDIMLKLYPDVDKRLRRAADGNVRAHLTQLEHEGRVRVHPGKERKENPVKLAGERALERARREIATRGRRIDAQERGRALARQESPPTEQWAQPPCYELSGQN